ncbi:MAG TPA: hypothetical protein VFQ07_01015, partial [Candidatus Polarisedimenticolia bacterium]|nr:hypothetical protein [Candidatus Polarisedimenticolia bacterium]
MTGVQEYRGFAKATWQVTPSTRLAASLNYDPQKYLNEGLNSLTREETGYTLKEGGTNVTLRSVSVLSPSVVLEGTLGFLDSHPAVEPNLGIDTNGNGVLSVDRNGDGFAQASERDPGTDWDGNGAWDVWEDTHVRNGKLDVWEGFPPGVTFGNSILFTEDVDGDGILTPRGGCEGAAREDLDCDGRLDIKDEDTNANGRLDGSEDLDGDHNLDRGIEDRNGDGILNDTPYPTDLYPYGSLRPTKQDRDYFINETTGVTEGPYYQSLEDTRQRASVRADLSVFVPDFKGTHDFRLGGAYERESFDRTTDMSNITALQPPVPPVCDEELGGCVGGRPESLVVVLPTQRSVEGSASGSTGAFYVQDTWKPVPNVSLGLGLRYEHETARAPGYTSFDPRREREIYNALVTLSGGEKQGDDLRTGNRDGVFNLGLSGDPMLTPEAGGSSGAVNDMVNALRLQAVRHLMRHRSNLEYTLDALSGLFDLGTGNDVDPERLSELGVTVQQPDQIAITNNNLSPRLSVSWDPAADGRTKVFGTWGRYYDKLFLNTIVGEQGPDTVYRYYGYDADGFDVSTPIGAYVSTPNHNVGRLFSKSPPSVHQVDRDLATPYSDEWTLGIERELAPEVALAVRFIRRDFRDQLQDVDINHQVVVNPATGEPYDLFGIYYEVPARPPATGSSRVQALDGRPDLFIENPFFNQVLRVQNSNTARYSALEVELRRRMARRWEMQGSYVYSRAQGNAEDFQSKVGNDPSVTESEYGYLSFDQRHVVKLNATIFLPRDFQLGFITSWSSGLPYSVISRFFASDNTGYAQFRTLFGYSTVNPQTNLPEFHSLPRNSERNNAMLDLNASLKKSFVLGRTTGAVSFDVMNILNSDDLYVVTYEPVTGSGYDVG